MHCPHRHASFARAARIVLVPTIAMARTLRAPVRSPMCARRSSARRGEPGEFGQALCRRDRNGGELDMGVLTDAMKPVVEQQRLGFVASVCADGTPNLSPKGTLSVLDD